MIHELRVYHCAPGRLPALNARFQNITLKFFEKYGIKPVGFWTTLVGDSNQTLTYLLEWESLAEREQKWGAFQQDQEWIANPKQKNSMFPQPLDNEDFQVWQSVLQHLIPLFEGKTVLAGDRKAGGFIAATAKLCPAGQGLSVPQFFNHPPRYPISQFQQNRCQDLCVAVNRQHKASGLLAFLEHYNLETARRGGDPMIYMRHFFWVN